MSALAAWPCPRWIAHRGAGRLAPENTLAALREGARHGWRAFECDVKLSADGVPFLLHDATLERTTDGRGDAGALDWAALSRLDAGGWHSRAYAGEPPASLVAVATYARANGYAMNLELKPSPGRERETGEVVAAQAARLWAAGGTPPLLSSFRLEALAGAQAAAAALPRALLLERLHEGWLADAQGLGCVAVVAHHALFDAGLVAALRAAGLKALTYTVNDPALAQSLLALGVEGIISDAVDRLSPAA